MKTLVITGGSSGIGKATAELFAAQGWKVFELSRSGQSTDTITHIACDVTRTEDTRKAMAEVIRRAGKIDLLISNAGFGISGAIEFTTSEDAHRQMEVNFFGALNTVQAVLPYMRERRAGRTQRLLLTPWRSPCRMRCANLASMSACSCRVMYLPALPLHAPSLRQAKRSMATFAKPFRRWRKMNKRA